jgi:hypothetical protein
MLWAIWSTIQPAWALRRRDVFAEGSERWSDPRARLLDGPAWQEARPRILTSLELEIEPAGHLAELAGALEGAHARVLDGARYQHRGAVRRRPPATGEARRTAAWCAVAYLPPAMKPSSASCGPAGPGAADRTNTQSDDCYSALLCGW